jgi:CAAX protease family protein
LTWRDGLVTWREFETRHPVPWRVGVGGLLAGSGAAVLMARGTLPVAASTRHAFLGLLILCALALGRRLFWNDGEARLRTLFRLAGFIGLVRLLGKGANWLGMGMNSEAMFAGGSSAMLRGTLAGLAVLTLAALVAVRLFDRRPVRELGIVPGPGFWGDLGFGLGLGVLLMSLVFGVEWLAGWATVVGTRWARPPDASFPRAFLNMTGVFLAVGFYEELASRGYLLRTLAQGFVGRRISPPWAIVIALAVSSAAFGFGHRGNPHATWVSTTNIVLAGVVLALPFILTGRLAGSIGLHITWNLFQGCVYGLPVSGLDAPASLLSVQVAGPAAWTGGPFGPEAGLLGLLAMLVGSAAILGRERWRQGRIALFSGLAGGGIPDRGQGGS